MQERLIVGGEASVWDRWSRHHLSYTGVCVEFEREVPTRMP